MYIVGCQSLWCAIKCWVTHVAPSKRPNRRVDCCSRRRRRRRRRPRKSERPGDQEPTSIYAYFLIYIYQLMIINSCVIVTVNVLLLLILIGLLTDSLTGLIDINIVHLDHFLSKFRVFELVNYEKVWF